MILIVGGVRHTKPHIRINAIAQVDHPLDGTSRLILKGRCLVRICWYLSLRPVDYGRFVGRHPIHETQNRVKINLFEEGRIPDIFLHKIIFDAAVPGVSKIHAGLERTLAGPINARPKICTDIHGHNTWEMQCHYKKEKYFHACKKLHSKHPFLALNLVRCCYCRINTIKGTIKLLIVDEHIFHIDVLTFANEA